MQLFLMNPDSCPTKWEQLLRIRRENPNFNTAAEPLGAGPPPTTPT